jgi:hypothetical protein
VNCDYWFYITIHTHTLNQYRSDMEMPWNATIDHFPEKPWVCHRSMMIYVSPFGHPIHKESARGRLLCRYLRGNGRFLQAEGATVSAPRNRADQDSNGLSSVVPTMGYDGENDRQIGITWSHPIGDTPISPWSQIWFFGYHQSIESEGMIRSLT